MSSTTPINSQLDSLHHIRCTPVVNVELFKQLNTQRAGFR